MRQTGEDSTTTEAEIRAMWPQAKEAKKKLDRKGRILLERLQGRAALPLQPCIDFTLWPSEP